MANICENNLLFNNVPSETFGKVLEYVKSQKSDFDFEKIIPSPKTKEECPKEFIIEDENKSGIQLLKEKKWFDWYNWNCENWGSKWNAQNIFIDLENQEINFSTAWSSPVPVFEKLAQLFPSADFSVSCIIEGSPNTLVGCNKNGKFTYETKECLTSDEYGNLIQSFYEIDDFVVGFNKEKWILVYIKKEDLEKEKIPAYPLLISKNLKDGSEESETLFSIIEKKEEFLLDENGNKVNALKDAHHFENNEYIYIRHEDSKLINQRDESTYFLNKESAEHYI